jgi:hypothetical protein
MFFINQTLWEKNHLNHTGIKKIKSHEIIFNFIFAIALGEYETQI